MAITYKRQDDLEKMLEEFASFDKLEEIEFPDPKAIAEKIDTKLDTN
ncbi:TPA: SPJ_0845 family protein [Streptococcus suis]